MNNQEKQVCKILSDAISDLPDEKKQYFIGFAEGVAAMAEQTKGNQSAGEGL